MKYFVMLSLIFLNACAVTGPGTGYGPGIQIEETGRLIGAMIGDTYSGNFSRTIGSLGGKIVGGVVETEYNRARLQHKRPPEVLRICDEYKCMCRVKDRTGRFQYIECY